MKKEFAESVGTGAGIPHPDEGRKGPFGAEKTATDLLAVDTELKKHLARLLLHFADPKTKTPLGVVIDSWVNMDGYTSMAFHTPKGLNPKKAGKASVKMVEFLEELVEYDGKAFIETDRRYPYKREICVLFFKPARLLKTLHALADESGEGWNETREHFEMTDTLMQRLGRYKASEYKHGRHLH